MTSYTEMRRQCDGAHYIKEDENGIRTCGPASTGTARVLCSSGTCPSRKYWQKSHKQAGEDYMNALRRVNLEEQYKRDIEPDYVGRED